MHRRLFLIGSGAAVSSLAGCSALDSGGGSSGPTSPVESLATAYASNDSASAEAAVHPEGPLTNDLPRSVEDRSLAVENATIVSRSAENATVRANVSVTSQSETWNEPREFELRAADGEWAIWSMQTGPELTLREYVAAVDEDRTDAALERLHPESPDREWIDESVVAQASLELRDLSVAESWSNEATIDVTVAETVGGETATRQRSVALQRTDEGWGVRSLRFGPVVPVYVYARAITRNDPELLTSIAHPDSDLASTDGEGIAVIEAVTVESITVTSIGADRATIDSTLRATLMGATQSVDAGWTLEPHEGEWMVRSTS